MLVKRQERSHLGAAQEAAAAHVRLLDLLKATQLLHTVNSPVSVSYPTCVTWTGFSGADIAGLFGLPTRLFMKLENPVFFLGTLVSFASSLSLCRGLLVPRSPRGVVMSSIRLPVAAKLWESRTSGFAKVAELAAGLGGRNCVG